MGCALQEEPQELLSPATVSTAHNETYVNNFLGNRYLDRRRSAHLATQVRPRTVRRMKQRSLLLTLVLAVAAAACGGSTDTTPRTTVSLPNASSVSSDVTANREDVYKALFQVPVLPLQVVQLSADGEDTTSVFLADGSFEVRYNGVRTTPGAFQKMQLIDGFSSAAIVTADGDGSLSWISWSDVAKTWREAVNNAVKEKYRAELYAGWSEGYLETMRATRVQSTFVAVAGMSAPGSDDLVCMESEAKASQNKNGSWTFECESPATSVTVWLDDAGRVSRLDYKDTVFSTSSTTKWGAEVASTTLEPLETAYPKASKQDIDALRRVFEQTAKTTADELARFEKLADERTND